MIARLRGNAHSIGVTIAIAAFLVTLQDAGVSILLPTIGRELGMGMRGIEWSANAYALALAVPLLATGRLVDAIGAERVLIAGLALLTGASLAAAVAPVAVWLDLARAGQGLGSALVAPAGLALAATRSESRGIGSCTGAWVAASASALAIGPILGGVLSATFGWRAIFLFSATLSAIAGAAVRRGEQPMRRQRAAVVRRGDALVGTAIVSIVLAVSEGQRLGWGSPIFLALVAISIASTCTIVALQRRGQDAVVAREVTRSPGFLGAALVTLLATAVMCSVLFFVALYLQLAAGLSVLLAGAVLLPMTVAIAAGAPLAGRLSDRIGPAKPATTGMAVLALALAALAVLGLGSGIAPLLPLLALVGVGVALVTAPTTAAALESVPPDARGAAAGALNTARMIGLVLGIAFMGAVAAARVPLGAAAPPATIADGLASAFLINALVALAVAFVAAAALRRAPTRRFRNQLGHPELAAP